MFSLKSAYVSVCYAFAVCFLVVGIWLLVAPGGLVALLNWQVSLVGLTGEIGLVAGDLDHVLSLSLMACVTVLAWLSARRPELKEPYLALLVAKVVSTAGFAYLAVADVSSWMAPAVADGLVVVLLVVARRASSPELASTNGSVGES